MRYVLQKHILPSKYVSSSIRKVITPSKSEKVLALISSARTGRTMKPRL